MMNNSHVFQSRCPAFPKQIRGSTFIINQPLLYLALKEELLVYYAEQVHIL